jgi:hypothetical protein
VSPPLRRLPRRRPDLRFREDGYQTVLFAPDDGNGHALNPTARAVWELCDGATTIDELATAICQVFMVPRDEAITDVAGVLTQLTEAELVVWDEPASESHP